MEIRDSLDQGAETDPEKWWKELERQRRAAGDGWTGLGGNSVNRSSSGDGENLAGKKTPVMVPISPRGPLARFARSFLFRLTAAAVLYATAWGWIHSGLPGSGDTRSWIVTAVSQDMDFQSVEAWYQQMFGGSPSFLPMFRSRGETQAVTGGWKKNEALLPVDGRLVLPFEQDGNGVRIAAPGGSVVRAVYAGRVLQVATEADGKGTVLIQHAGHIVTVYGNLEQPAVQPNDWVEAGQRIGRIPSPLDEGGESLLYFSVKQNGKTVDPANVVPFD